MKVQLEYTHDSNDSKIWIIEKKGKNIKISFGKKNNKLNETILNYSTEQNATDDYNKRINEKLKKGYHDISKTKNIKNNKTKESKNSKTKENKNDLYIETINPYIKNLLNFTKEISIKQEKEYKNTNNKDIIKKMSIYFNDRIPKFENTIKKYQSKKTMPFLSSGIITKKIPNILTKNMYNSIVNFSNKTKIDYHPHSNNKVRDIVHPSIYPLLVKIKKTNNKTDIWNRPYEDSKFQWLPSNFYIDKNGECKIKSYINNLPNTEIDMYNNIEKIFNFVLPYFEDIWSWIKTVNINTDTETHKYVSKKIFKKQSLKNRTLQVITKIVTISLKSKDDLIGAFHIEGMPHENIVATASCTLYQDENFKSSLSFKRTYTSDEELYLIENINQNPIKEIYDLVKNTYIPLGTQKINKNMLIVFPNCNIHKVDMINKSTKEQKRTIIVFWLINPDVSIKSTSDIKQQNYPLKQAHKNRLELMKERTIHKQTFNKREINLCEH
jgi:predicted DNA-binding WGR domain protein